MKQNFKEDFPLLSNQDIVYFDSAATAQRPRCVIDAQREFYEECNANPLRGFYNIAMEATQKVEDSRSCVKEFINARTNKEIIFTRNTTESINLVAFSWGLSFLHEGDEILVTIAEHHSNMLPWKMVAEKTGATIRYLKCSLDGSYSEESIKAAVTSKTKFAAIQHVSNVLGSITPVDTIIELVHANGGKILIDAAQSTPHMRVDVQKMDADFLVFSGHKIMGPMGIGVLYGKEELLEKMPPFLTGGEMIESVSIEKTVFASLPHKFEAGTVNAAGAYGLKAAIDYINSVGIENIENREKELTRYAFNQIEDIEGIKIIGSADPDEHNGIISFIVDKVHPHDISAVLSENNIAVRAGHHCAQPLLKHLGINSCTRASISFYNTYEDIDMLIKNLKSVRRLMGLDG